VRYATHAYYYLECDMMSYSELSDEEKSLIFSMFDQGWEPKDVSKETNVSYDQIITQRNKWDLKQRGFTSWKDYKNHIADKQGFSTYIEYQRYTSKRLRVKGKVVDLLVETGIIEDCTENTVTQIAYDFRHFKKKFGLKGRGVKTVVAGIIYGVLRKQKLAITLDDVCVRFGENKKDVRRVYNTYATMHYIPPQSVEGFIRRGCKELTLSKEAEQHCLQFYNDNKDILKGFDARVSAAVCILIQSHQQCEWRTRNQVSKAMGISTKRVDDLKRTLKRNNRT